MKDSVQCPRCGKTVDHLQAVDTALRVSLETTNMETRLPPSVCVNCYSELTSSVSQGLKLRIEAEQREKNKMTMWKHRVELVKQARQHMLYKGYSEAAVLYEKYLRVIELVYNKKKGELSPEIFNNSKHSKELNVIAAVYWDLLRIYDSSPRHMTRMQETADMLARFLPHSHLYPHIARKADQFLAQSNNPEIIRQFMIAVKAKIGRCFIATAAFENSLTEEILFLQNFRDQKLKSNALGRRFIKFYYKVSPSIALFIARHSILRMLTRWGIKQLISFIKLVIFILCWTS